MKYLFIILIFLGPYLPANSQRKRPKTVNDTITTLGCPFAHGIMKTPSQEGVGYKGDVKMIITSVADTLVLSPIDGKIDLITLGEGGRYEVVLHHNDYNFWLLGVGKMLVKKGDVLKKGDSIGKSKPGDEIEFLFFNDEEPVDPKKFLDCHQ